MGQREGWREREGERNRKDRSGRHQTEAKQDEGVMTTKEVKQEKKERWKKDQFGNNDMKRKRPSVGFG